MNEKLVTWKEVRIFALITFVVNVLIGSVHHAINMQGTLLHLIVFSNIIGFSICFFCLGCASLARSSRQLVLALVGAVPLGIWVGRTLGEAYLGFPVRSLPHALAQAYLTMPQSTTAMMLSGLVVGGIVTIFFYLRGRHTFMTRQLETERLRLAASEGERNKALLQRLQAQIEPHFLFNTLATLDGLIASEPQQARALLVKFTDYLRATLQRTREEGGTLADELAVIQGYLGVMQARLGTRLQWKIALPAGLETIPFPSMLLQPLVENAVSHGIEASETGGCIDITVRLANQILQVEVIDSGVGLLQSGVKRNAGGHGIGLANVRQRLRLLHGDAARLDLYANQPRGVTARITMPCPLH